MRLVGEQPLFEMVAPAAHVRPALSTARNDSVAGDDERNLAQTNRDEINSEEANLQLLQILSRYICLFLHTIYFFRKKIKSTFIFKF